MASLRNAIPRKTHKERSQPAARAKLGHLEKHKDYVERAQDFHRKVKKINNLRKKATEKNPDEFYFGMISSTTKNGVHQELRQDGSDKMTHAQIKHMKTQDLSFLHRQRAVGSSKAAKLQSQLHLLTDKPINKHTVFLDDQAAVENFDAADHFDTAPELVGRTFNRPRKAALHADNVLQGPQNAKELMKAEKQRRLAYETLAKTLERGQKLDRAMDHKVAEKNVMGKGRKRKVKAAEDGKPAVYKWKRKRAR
eukprot:FR740008.1.p1 GENE.FR740008.1~~FR740008.1.p1  ORF type:complete len:252 (+),score=37.65 FR740008.1:62-817(+)